MAAKFSGVPVTIAGMTRSSFLRVYIPAEKYPAQEVAPGAGSLRTLRVSRYGLLNESMLEDALVAEWSGRRFVCPRNPRLRMLEGLLAFHSAYQEIGGDLIVPESTARVAGRELRRLYDSQPAARSHILTSPWHVPLRWFAAFDPGEREVVRSEEMMRVRYRTPLGQASERLARAVETLKEAGFQPSIVEDVEDLGDWLEDFPEDAMVELDYDGVAELFAESDLVLDESAADVWASLEALERGDLDEAAERYGVVATRWAPAVALTYSN